MRAIILLITMLALHPSFARAELVTDLGQRPAECKNLVSDDFEWDPHLALMHETKTLFSANRLKDIIIAGNTCFRVGTEIKIMNLKGTYKLLGRAVINSIETLTTSQLKNKELAYTPQVIDDFINQTAQNQYTILTIKVTQKVTETILKSKYDRLNTCFPSFSDWKDFRLPNGNDGIKLAEQIKTKQVVAQINNGLLNCYKVGTEIPLSLFDKKSSNLGKIKITELHIVHSTNLSKDHAQLLNMSLEQLKTQMKTQKDLDGGYTNITVFKYLTPQRSIESLQFEAD